MFNICFIGDEVVESESVVEYRLTKCLNYFSGRGGKRIYISGDISLASIALKVCRRARKKDLSLRYFYNPLYPKSKTPLRKYGEMIDNCEVIVSYYDPAKNDLPDNVLFNYARAQKKTIVNLFQGESHYWFGERVDDMSGEEIKKMLTEYMKNDLN